MNTIKLNDNPLVFWGDNHGYWGELMQFITMQGYKHDDWIEDEKKLEAIQTGQEYKRPPKHWNCIQVGDMGMGMRQWRSQKTKLTDLNDFLKEHNCLLYAIRGNHDDPSYFTGTSAYSNIVFLEDYTVLQHDTGNILCIGGAISIDRSKRKRDNITLNNIKADYRSYFKKEKFVWKPEVLDEIFETMKIDIVVTHSAPKNFPPIGFNNLVRQWAQADDLSRTKADKANGVDLIMELVAERKDIERVQQKFIHNPPKTWFYGHFHYSETSYIDGIETILLDIDEFHIL